MRCDIELRPPDMTVGYTRVALREKLLRRLLGGKIQTAIIIPGNTVKRLSFENDQSDDRGDDAGNES